MGKYCADCAYMDTNMKSNHKYKCINSRRSGYDEVSCCMPHCSNFCPSSRDSYYNQEMYSYSYKRGYYLTTLICNVLGIDEERTDKYVGNMAYMKDVMLPLVEGGNEWIAEYDTFGPKIAVSILRSGRAREICEDLYARYLEPFNQIFESDMDEAFKIYDKMFQETKSMYCDLDKTRVYA